MNTKKFNYEHPRPAVTVDCVLFGFDDGELRVLLIQRDIDPFKNGWALPGGFVRENETLEQAAIRELEEETGVKNVYLEQLYTYGSLNRDPRERVISIAYYALVKLEDHRIQAATDARNAAWFPVQEAPSLAFDHEQILGDAHHRLKGKVRYEPIGFELLPKLFTLRELQHLYEACLEEPIDKRNFRKKILSMDLLKETNQIQKDVAHRAARLYRFDSIKYKSLKTEGFNFRL